MNIVFEEPTRRWAFVCTKGVDELCGYIEEISNPHGFDVYLDGSFIGCAYDLDAAKAMAKESAEGSLL